MKTIRLTLLSAASFVLAGAFATASPSFEGIVTTNFVSDNEPVVMSLKTKDGKIRFDHPEMRGMGYAIMDVNAEEMIVVMESQRMFMRQPFHEASAETMTGDLEATGETKRILGYQAEQYIYREDGEKTELWVTDELPGFFMSPNPSSTEVSPAMRSLLERNVFLLAATTHDANGRVTAKMEVTGIEKTSLDASEFQAPEGFREMQMPSF